MKTKKTAKGVATSLLLMGLLSFAPTTGYAIDTFFDVTSPEGYPHIEWAVDMPPENIINKTSFEDGDEIPHAENDIAYVESSGRDVAYAKATSNQQVIYTARGYVTKEQFEQQGLSNFTTSQIFWDMNLYEPFSRYLVFKDGTTRWDYGMWTQGLQGVTSDEAYEGSNSYYYKKTLDNKLGNAFNTIYQENTIESRTIYKDNYDLKNGMHLSLSFMLKTKGNSNFDPFVIGGQAMRTFPFTEAWV